MAKIEENGSVGDQLIRLFSPLHASLGVNYHGIRWSLRNGEPRLYVISDATGWWNIYEVTWDEKGNHFF